MSFKVVLDAGHGGKDSGAVGFGRKEKDDVLRLTLRVGALLQANKIQVIFTRTTDVYESVTIKARKANQANVDFFASFHRNSSNGMGEGSETLVYQNRGRAKACADRANQKMEECGFKQRGTKVRTDLVVLNSTHMEAVLFETGFIDNPKDNTIFDSKFEQIAQGYAEAILVALGQGTAVVKPSPSPEVDVKPLKIDMDYAVMIKGGQKLPNVRNLEDFAGIRGKSIVGFCCRPSQGTVKYRVHLKGDGWLPWVTGFDWNDFHNGYAGDGVTAIDAIEVYLYSPKNDQYAFYRVSPLNKDYYPYQRDNEKSNVMDGYAGAFGVEIDRIQMYIKGIS